MSSSQDPIADGVHTEHVKMSPNITMPERINSAYADKAMVAIDHDAGTATITLMVCHYVPKLSENWSLQNVVWEVIGEVKMTVAAMNALAGYYLSDVSGINVFNLIRQYQRANPNAKQPIRSGTSYGPFAIHEQPPVQSQGVQSDKDGQ